MANPAIPAAHQQPCLSFGERLRKRIAGARKGISKRPKVLVLLGVGRTPYTFLSNSWGGDVITQAGGRLLTAGLRDGGGFARISDEVVLAAQPDVIIGVPHASKQDIPAIARAAGARPARAGRARAGQPGVVMSLLEDPALVARE